MFSNQFYLSCNFHGCKKCFLPTDIQANIKTAEENYNRTELKMYFLNKEAEKLGYIVEQVWECDVKIELKKNKRMREFFRDIPDKGPIDPRTAFHGGKM